MSTGLTRRPEGVAALAGDDWWMETFVQLAGLTDDADRLGLMTAGYYYHMVRMASGPPAMYRAAAAPDRRTVAA